MSEPTDANLREIWREGLRSTGPVPAPADYDAFDHGITAAIRAVWDAARADPSEEITPDPMKVWDQAVANALLWAERSRHPELWPDLKPLKNPYRTTSEELS